nr:DNA repair protein RecO [Thiorhodococcus mannitoliphagus]
MHRRDYSDTSLLLEVFAVGEGRFPAIAKGARRKKSTASALLQPFQPLWLGATGRGEVRTLTRVEGAGAAIALRARALIGGFYLNELLMRLLGRNDPHDALFAFYQVALTALAEGQDLDTVLRQFELRLLDEIGYGMTLDRAASDGIPVRSDLSYVYDQELGVRLSGLSEPGLVLSGATLLALAAGEPLEAEQRREARSLLRIALAPHLGGKPLQSRELYRRWFGADG